MVDLEIDESKLWDPEKRQQYMDELPEMTLFEDHIVEGDLMVDAIQALIEEGETAESLALHWKSRGNKMYQDAKRNRSYYENALKNYSDALAYALKALALPDEEKDSSYNMNEQTSQIYSNRAAVHLELRNYGSCRSDVAKALRYDPTNVKAYFRGAKASKMLRKPEDTLRYCAAGLRCDPENKLLQKLQKEGEELLKEVRIEMHKKEFERKKRRAYIDKYRQLCATRSVKVGRALIDDERVKQYEGKADLDAQSGQMCWPVLFLYDEHGTSDFVQVFSENDTFIEHFANMFPEDGPFVEWDLNEEYVASRLVVYAAANVVIPYAEPVDWYVGLDGELETDDDEMRRLCREDLHDAKTQQWIEISLFCTLHQLLSHEKYVVPGVPVLNIFLRESKPLHDFLRNIDHKVITLGHQHQ